MLCDDTLQQRDESQHSAKGATTASLLCENEGLWIIPQKGAAREEHSVGALQSPSSTNCIFFFGQLGFNPQP